MASEGCVVVLVAAFGPASRLMVWQQSADSVAMVGTMFIASEMFRIKITLGRGNTKALLTAHS